MFKISSVSSKAHGIITDNNNSFVLSNFGSIASPPTNYISNYITHLDFPKKTKYPLFKTII